MIRPKLILGPPGSGKTTALLNIAEEEMANGVPANEIAFVTFTKAGAREASQRAARRFTLDADVELPWYRTLHSLAYRQMSVARDEVMNREDWREFGRVVGMEIDVGGMDEEVEGPIAGLAGSASSAAMMIRLVDYAATTLQPLDAVWHEANEPVDWWSLRRFADAYKAYKDDTGKLDFNDMLLNYAATGKPVPVRVAIIDEGQDLTAAQWAVARRAFSEAERVYIAGDDDQAIYRWAGADVEHFLNLSETPQVLGQSYRLPRVVFEVGQSVARRIRHRYEKPYAPRPEEGAVTWHMEPDRVDLRGEGTWLLLARNNYMLAALEGLARDMGVNYARRGVPAVKVEDVEAMVLWEHIRGGKLKDLSAAQVRALLKALNFHRPTLRELTRYAIPKEWPIGKIWHEALVGIPRERRDYYLSCRRRGEKLLTAPRVRIETIHGAKGAEADHVVLMTDMSARTFQGYQNEPDAEHRVFYVGITRARQHLHLIRPQTGQYYWLAS